MMRPIYAQPGTAALDEPNPGLRQGWHTAHLHDLANRRRRVVERCCDGL